MLEFIRKKIFLISNQYNSIDKHIDIKGSYVSGSTITGQCEIGIGCKIFKAHIEGEVKIGKFTSLWGPNIFILGRLHGVEIGRFCSIARNVSIQEDYHNLQRLSTYFFERNIFNLPPHESSIISKGKIKIGNDVWIGAGATILSGVDIGNGAVIASNAVVTKDVPSFAVVAGNPAHVVKYRFSKEVIDKIEQMKWWEWPLDKIKKEKHLFLGNFQ